MIIKKKIDFLKLIQIWGISLIVAISASIIILDVVISYQDFNSRADQMRKNYVTQQKQIIKREVDRVVEMVKHEKAKSENLTKTKIKSRVYEAYSIAEHIYQQNKTTKSISEIEQMILNALRPVRFEHGNGYYFISRPDGVAQLFPSNPKLEGKDLLSIKDTQGQYITKDMINIIKQSGEGFYQYHWDKPGKGGNSFKKISFIKKFEPFDWFIGTGLYIDDVENDIRKGLLLSISKIRFGKEGYVFVNRLNGDALVSNGKLIQGIKKLWEVFNKNPEKVKELFKKEYNAAIKPKGDYIYYSLIKLTDPGKESPKVSFISGVPGMQWLIGAGVYLDDIETNIAVMHTELNKQNKEKILFFILIVTAIAALFLYLSHWLTRKLQNDFNLFSSFFEKAALSDEKIDLDLIHSTELELMAKNANKMLKDKFNAQQDLITEKERLSITIHSIGDGVITTDISGRVNLINKVARDLTGWKADTAHGKPLNDIFHIVNAKTLKKAENPVEQVLKSKKIIDLASHTMLKSKDGSEYQIADSAAPIKNANGDITGVVLVFRDVTKKYKMREDLRQSEAKSIALLNAIPDLMLILSRDGVFLDYHVSNTDDLFILPKTFLGKEVQDVFPEAIASPLMVVFEHALSTNQVQNYEYQLQIDGQNNYFIARIIPYGKNRVLTIVSNITESKRAEKELQQIERLNSVGTLAGGIAHDFNNILTSIYGNISIVKGELSKNHPGYKFLKEAELSMNRATRLTNQLLTFAKGGVPVKEDISISTLVKEVVSFDLSGSNIKPVFNQAEDLWMADVDKGQIQQVFSNLTINARQAMPEGGHLYINITNVDMTTESLPGLRQKRYIKITIKDEGSGIDSKYRNRIFDPYFTTKQTGSGLGLATCYSILNKHGGSITFDTEFGKGTTFTLYLPASEVKEFLTTAQPVNKPRTTRQPARVLVMDDEKMICDVVSKILEKTGYSVDVAFDGKEAIEMYKNAMKADVSFDVVIMDLTIPGGIGGKEAVKKILDIDPEAKVIVSSGYADNPVMANYTEYGFKGIISKPFTINNLQKVLSQVLDKNYTTHT